MRILHIFACVCKAFLEWIAQVAWILAGREFSELNMLQISDNESRGADFLYQRGSKESTGAADAFQT